jgi:hypothetical protein
MSQEACVTPAHVWAEYEALQSRASRVRKINSYAWALEDQLNCVLNSDELSADPESRSISLKNLLLNRIKKHTRRNRLLEEQYHQALAADCFSEDSVIQVLDSEKVVAKVRAAVSDAEWKILGDLAQGDSYDEVAQREQVGIGALKSKVCRCRQRLKAIAA